MDDFEYVEINKGVGKKYTSVRCNIENIQKAKCTSCGVVTNSHPDLPMFTQKLTSKFDSYYCGDRGFD